MQTSGAPSHPLGSGTGEGWALGSVLLGQKGHKMLSLGLGFRLEGEDCGI